MSILSCFIPGFSYGSFSHFYFLPENRRITRKITRTGISIGAIREKIPPIITKQLNGYILSGISTLDIARCINYYCETLKKEISSIYGISFVPNILEEVQKYFKKLQEIRDQGQLTGVEIVNTEIRTYKIKGKIKHKSRKINTYRSYLW